MPHPQRPSSIVPLLAALACTPAEPAPQPSSPARADASSEPVPGTTPAPQPSSHAATTPAAPSADAPSEPTPGTTPAPDASATPSPEPVPSASVDPSPLRVVAVREGAIELSGWGTGLVPVLEGEPLSIVDGRPVRGPAGSRGVLPSAYLDPTYTVVDFGGRLDRPGGAWLTLSTQEERSAAVNLVYHAQGPAWQPLDLRRGLLRAYYSFYVERDGALLAYQRWDLDHEQAVYDDDEGSPQAMRFQERVRRALAKVDVGLVQLTGAPVELPVVPNDGEPYAAVSTADGTLYLAISPNQYDAARFLLVWPPGASDPRRVVLPGLGSGYVELSVAGEWVLAHGEDAGKGYLAVGKGTEWQHVSVEAADRETKAYNVDGAARAPDGALWISFGDRWNREGEEHPVWRKPADGEWEPVPLPAFDRAWFPTEPEWGLEIGWDVEDGVLRQAMRASTLEQAATPFAMGLRWGDDAVWVSLQIGDAHATSALGLHPRSVLLRTGPAGGPETPVVLPSAPALHLERYNHAHQADIPGARTCQHPALVLGPASLADERPEVVKALKDAKPPTGDATKPGIDRAYVGELDGTRVLVGLARARTPTQAKALAAALGEATGLEITAGCRIPTVERML